MYHIFCIHQPPDSNSFKTEWKFMNILLLAKFRHVEITTLAASIKPMKYCHLRPIWQCLEQGRVNKECGLINDPHYVGVCCIAMANQGTVTRKLHVHPPPLSSACDESITILSAPDGGAWWLFSMHFRHTQKSHTCIYTSIYTCKYIYTYSCVTYVNIYVYSCIHINFYATHTHTYIYIYKCIHINTYPQYAQNAYCRPAS